MKRFVAFITAAAMSVSMLASCGKNDDDSSSKSTKSESSKSTSASGISSKGSALIKGAGVVLGIGGAVLIPSMIGYTKKSKLLSANSNAKLVFTVVNGAVADLQADGREQEIAKCSQGRKLRVSELDRSSFIDSALYNAISDNGSEDGMIYFEIDSSYKVIFAQWMSPDGTVGQYPYANSDVNTNYTFGEFSEEN